MKVVQNRRKTGRWLTALAAGAGLSLLPSLSASLAADLPTHLPKATQKMMAELKLDPGILSGLDRELDVPKAWIEAAKKEGEVRVSSSWDPGQYKKMIAPLRERYPFLHFEYSRGSRQERVLQPLIAYQSGRIVTDLVGGLGATFTLYKKAGALADMRDIPNFANAPKGMRDEGGLWVGERLRYWCMSYNTNLVKKADLPKTWDDLLTNPIWRGGHLAISNRPNLWLGPISNVDGYGLAWAKDYMTRLFNDVQPQLRKEGNNALLGLVIAGEFRAAVPSADYRTKQYVEKGAPVGWHCPEPVPLSISELGMIKGNPHPFASKIWVNWFLSKEGQIAQYYANFAPPVHKDLQLREFLPFPDEIQGRKVAFRDPIALERDMPKLIAIWKPLWENGTKKQK